MIDNNENVQVNSTFTAPNLDDSKEDESILIVICIELNFPVLTLVNNLESLFSI